MQHDGALLLLHPSIPPPLPACCSPCLSVCQAVRLRDWQDRTTVGTCCAYDGYDTFVWVPTSRKVSSEGGGRAKAGASENFRGPCLCLVFCVTLSSRTTRG